MGRLIPAGTGVPVYHDLTMRVAETDEAFSEISDEPEFDETPSITSA